MKFIGWVSYTYPHPPRRRIHKKIRRAHLKIRRNRRVSTHLKIRRNRHVSTHLKIRRNRHVSTHLKIRRNRHIRTHIHVLPHVHVPHDPDTTRDLECPGGFIRRRSRVRDVDRLGAVPTHGSHGIEVKGLSECKRLDRKRVRHAEVPVNVYVQRVPRIHRDFGFFRVPECVSNLEVTRRFVVNDGDVSTTRAGHDESEVVDGRHEVTLPDLYDGILDRKVLLVDCDGRTRDDEIPLNCQVTRDGSRRRRECTHIRGSVYVQTR